MITGEYLTVLIGGDWVFSLNTDSLGCQPFKGASWALVLGLPLRDTIKGLFLVHGPFLIPMFGLVSWAHVPIISNPIISYQISAWGRTSKVGEESKNNHSESKSRGTGIKSSVLRLIMGRKLLLRPFCVY